METKKEHWPLLSFKEYEKDINPNPTYQRSAVWKPNQKRLLIDSILRKIDIPKLYLRETNSNGFTYEIIDGQQRMRALWEFLSNKYALSEEAEEVLVGDELFEVAESTYDELPPKLKLERIHKYTLDVVIIQQATEDEIADLFYRLNNGTPLKPAEVRNAMPGEMTKLIREQARHGFFSKVSFANFRYAYDQVAAQMMMLELNGGPSDIPDRLLSKMYADYQKKAPKSAIDRMTQVLDTLDKLFPARSRLLNRAETVNLYLLISFLQSGNKLTKSFYADFLAWYQESEAKRLRDNEYKLYMTSAANSRRSVEERFKIVIMDFFTSFPGMATIQLDSKRVFDNDQKIQLYARDNQRCQSCKRSVGEFDWHADHVVAWIRGGKTTLDNGQVLCVKCNLKKKDRLW
ncbi:MAG TPA: DUF262 domain-containing protein [Pyrinomonadaceae bacterium]|nr:DUF262 domain-containing protein [Pyrinomonadaceae bacterium]